MGKPDIDRVAQILVDAYLIGDPRAAKHWGITDRTIRNYRARMETDEALSSRFLQKKREVEADWVDTSKRFLARSIAKLEDLVQSAGPDQIREVAGAIKIVGELDVVRSALKDGQQPERADQGPTASTAEGGPAAEGSYLQ